MVENYPEDGESLLVRKAAVGINETVQRRILFRTVCKTKGKCYKLIIDSGSTNNLVSIEIVDKLELKKTVNP